MKKKLSVKVVHYAEGKYVIKYCIYYIFPLFYSYLYNSYHSILGYTFSLWSYEDMEKYAKTLDINKIKEIENQAEQECIKYRNNQREFYKKNVPYHSKRII